MNLEKNFAILYSSDDKDDDKARLDEKNSKKHVCCFVKTSFT